MSDFLERNLEDIIFENKETVSERGLTFFLDNTLRQFVLPSGKKIDLFSYSINGTSLSAKIFELKKDCLQYPDLIQVIEYESELYRNIYHNFSDIHIEKILIGNSTDKTTEYLAQDMLHLEVFTYKYMMDGIYFKRIYFAHELTREELDMQLKPLESGANLTFRLKEIDRNRKS